MDRVIENQRKLDDWLAALLIQMTPSARKKLTQHWASTLRRSQQQRIQQQVNPDNSPYRARKQSRIRRKLFSKIKTARYLKVTSSPDMAEVYFSDPKTQKIAETHHYGLREKIGKRGPIVQYPKRRLLGITDADVALLEEAMLGFFCGKIASIQLR